MKIVHLTRDFPPHHRGGISAVVEGMVRASSDAGLSAEIQVLNASAGVVLCPSLFETFGMAAPEAMSHGAAVVATTAGGLAELIEKGETGLLSAPGDVEAFAVNILELLDNSREAQRLGATARRRVEESWLWPSVFPGIMEIYHELQ